jgi:hypothetical protein
MVHGISPLTVNVNKLGIPMGVRIVDQEPQIDALVFGPHAHVAGLLPHG